MAEEIRHPDGRIEHPSVRSERSDVSSRWIGRVLLAGVILAIVILWGVWQFFRGYSDHLTETRRSSFPQATEATALPPEPRVEQLDRLHDPGRTDVFLRHAGKLARLKSYGSTEEKGFIHIPIERAMDLLANKLPAREQPPEELLGRGRGLVNWGESNSGRLLRKKEP